MKFFVPVSDPREADKAYRTIRLSVAKQMDVTISPRRIYKITGAHEGKPFSAAVGERFEPLDEIVAAILFDDKSKSYFICPLSRGVAKGRPYSTERGEIGSPEDFEEQNPRSVGRTWNWKKMKWIVGWLATIGLLASLILGFFGVWEKFNPHNHIKVAQAIVLGIWILLAPMWFWFEYFFLFQDETKSGVKLEEFKHGQDQSAKIWLALVTVLAGLYFGKDLVREEQTPPCTPGSSGAPANQLKPQFGPVGNVPASKPRDLGPHQ